MDVEAVCGRYTIAMIADLIAVPIAAVRHWRRRLLLEPTRTSGSLEWFDYGELVVGRRLAKLLESGLSLQEMDRQLAQLPGNARALARGHEPLFIEDGHLYLWRKGQYVGAGGQLAFSFAASEPIARTLEDGGEDMLHDEADGWETVDDLLCLSADLERCGHLVEAAEAIRAVLQATPPTAQLAFLLAELLYQAGDLTAARERYYMAVELDHDHLEARTSLGCVLEELGEHDLAKAALEGVVRQEPDHAEAHWHLAGVLESLDQNADAARHLLIFMALAPHSPWCDVARTRLAKQTPPNRKPRPR
ncbi:MAG: tetratricopeptide repeat protein [Pirellulales bacterium]